MTRVQAVLVSLLAILGILTVSGCARPAEPKGEIVIGAIGALTGPSADLGNNLRQGVELALEKINGAGGVNGHKLKVVFKDDESNPAKSVAALQDLITRDKVVAIIGPTNTAPATALLPYTNEAQIVHINSGATGTRLIDPKRYPYAFRTIYYNELQAAEMVDYAVKVRGWKRLAILHDKTALGVDGGADLQHFVREAGLTPTIVESYNSGDADLTLPMMRMRDAQPDAILSWALGADVATALKAMQSIGYKVPYINYSGALLKTVRDLAGDAIGDALACASGRVTWADDPTQLDPAVMELIARREKRFGVDDKISFGALASHYDAVMLLAEALKQTNSTSSASLKAAIEEMRDFKGVANTYSYGPDDHEGFDIGSMKIVYFGVTWNGTFKQAPTR